MAAAAEVIVLIINASAKRSARQLYAAANMKGAIMRDLDLRCIMRFRFGLTIFDVTQSSGRAFPDGPDDLVF